ncbi:sulfite exporter TauE/SafE family protein [Butyrivibrio sp. MB2005]|uniref:sulfite exporter TauE/SafE family protein n=1 Tax=Butyrivibrio sp. MB2005 TaxID=1280678 RepID=UPI00040F128F|nr:sulfite exporter TauE/SafE family protein [Butyrivibrio sp. MB2005]
MNSLGIWIIATLVAFFIKGLCGFANTLVFTSILGFGINNVNISPVELVLGFPSNVILTWSNRKKLNPRIYVPLIILTILGSIPGAFLLKNVDAHVIKIIFGVVVVLVGIEMLLKEYDKLNLKYSTLALFIIGMTGGLMCGLFGVGVLMAVCVSKVTETSSEFKANLSIIFIVENIVRIITYAFVGIITPDSLKLAFILIPFMLIGVFTGMKSATLLDEKKVKKLVIVLLILSGISLIAKNLA